METVLIFLPKSLSTYDENGYLLGRFSPKNATASDCFYVLAADDSCLNDEVIGSFQSSNSKRREKNSKKNYLTVSCINGQLIVNKVVKESKICPLNRCHVIEYDETSLIKSELFIPQDSLLSDDYLQEECDYFKLLAHQLKRKESASLSKTDESLPKYLQHVFALFHWLSYGLEVSRLSTYSSIGSHLREHIANLQWLIEKTWRDGGVNLQTGNLLCSLILDLLGGLAVACTLEEMTMGGRIHFFNLMASKTEDLLELIKYMIKWLMGSPAGLKLNYPLNYILGNFFLYNIYLWWTFLGLIRPLLEIGFKAFLKLGVLGIALQIAILADIFSLVTFHLYCIYIYAARLYEFQLKGLCSLSKIFLGRNRNPEPDKVDSCPYSTEQLFVGTVCFTVLLFLLPTSLVYYVVFTLIRLGFIFLGGALTHARFLLRILPIYSSIVWIAHPQLTMTTTKLMPVCGTTDAGVVTLIAQPEVSSWWQTMRLCVPQVLKKPQSVDWRGTIKHVLTGKLMYPV